MITRPLRVVWVDRNACKVSIISLQRTKTGILGRAHMSHTVLFAAESKQDFIPLPL